MYRRSFLAAAAAVPLAATLRTRAAEPVAEVKLTPTMEQAREAALKILKPTAKELERGLRLHQEAIVFDSYGFAPRAAMDGMALRKAYDSGATDAELQDLREEMGMLGSITNAEDRAEFETAWKASGVTCIFQNAGEESSDPMRLLVRLGRFTHLTDRLRDIVSRATHPDDILAAKKAGRHCLYLTGNGVPLTQQWQTVEDELKYIRTFYQLGIRMMHVTYNRRNVLGDGCAEEANGGLSDLGRAAVKEMNRVGVIVDVAHSGWRTSLEAAKVSSKPMVASHTTCAALRRHIRSKPDEVIRAIADTDGLVGICCIPQFLGGGIRELLDHIDYVVRKFGAKHVAIGTDIAHSSPSRGPAGVGITRKTRTRYEALWPPEEFITLPEHRLSLAWTNWPLYTVGMVQRGFADDDIRQILGENTLRVCRAVQG